MLYTEGAVIMGMVHFLLPYMVLNIYVSLEGIDRNLISAARTSAAPVAGLQGSLCRSRCPVCSPVSCSASCLPPAAM